MVCVCMFVCSFGFLDVCMRVRLFVCLFVCLYVCMSVWKFTGCLVDSGFVCLFVCLFGFLISVKFFYFIPK